jgi:hypothetical protein
VSDEEDVEYGVTIIEPLLKVDPLSIGYASPKRYIVAAIGAEFDVLAARSKTLETQPPFKSGEKAGQPRPDKKADHVWVIAKHPAARFKLHFKGGSFSEAWVWDAAGWPTELWHDYTPSNGTLKQSKDETEKSWQQRVREETGHAERQDREYNDGEFWVNQNMRLVKTAGDLDQWFADLVPGFTVRKKPVRKPKQADLEAKELLAVGEWVG